MDIACGECVERLLLFHPFHSSRFDQKKFPFANATCEFYSFYPDRMFNFQELHFVPFATFNVFEIAWQGSILLLCRF
jgi:hypothetical protein